MSRTGCEGYDPAFGARPLRRTINRRIENELARRILSGDVHEGQCVEVDFAEGEFGFTARESDTPRRQEAIPAAS